MASIGLDYTLRDLYCIDNEKESNIVLIFYSWPLRDQDAVLPPKFLYECTGQGTSKAAAFAMAATIIPQRHGFAAGKMPLIIFEIDSGHDAIHNFSQLRPDQQPILNVVKNPRKICLDSVGAEIAVPVPADCLSHLPHLVDPETHYEILSKRGLALSGLPTPPSLVVDSNLTSAEVHDPTLLSLEIAQLTEAIDDYKLPFIIKLAQTASAKGTYPVITDDDRVRVKEILTTRLGVKLPQINAANQHMYSCSLVFQDFIEGTAVGLSIFVTKKGRAIFVACCEQRFDEHGHWNGGTISYSHQAALEKRYAGTAEKVTSFLHRKGYYGPAGVDVITDQLGTQYVIDLNVRVTGTYHLGPLAGHFVKRGLFEAATVTEYLSCQRRTFEKAFSSDIQQGRLIINGWVRDESLKLSYAAITIGAENLSELDKSFVKIESYMVSH